MQVFYFSRFEPVLVFWIQKIGKKSRRPEKSVETAVGVAVSEVETVDIETSVGAGIGEVETVVGVAIGEIETVVGVAIGEIETVVGVAVGVTSMDGSVNGDVLSDCGMV